MKLLKSLYIGILVVSGYVLLAICFVMNRICNGLVCAINALTAEIIEIKPYPKEGDMN